MCSTLVPAQAGNALLPGDSTERCADFSKERPHIEDISEARIESLQPFLTNGSMSLKNSPENTMIVWLRFSRLIAASSDGASIF